MKRRPIGANRAGATCQLRYNLFRCRWQPDLCCAVPEDRPVPSFVTGERWDFGGTWEGAIPAPGLNPIAAELTVRLNGFHLFQFASPLENTTNSECPERDAVCGELARGEELVLQLEGGRSVLPLF
jgi:hypothetical protein